MDELTAQQEIAFIKKVMQDSRKVVYADGKEFIYWGVLVTICLLFTYFSVYFRTEKYIAYFWISLMMLGFIGNSIFFGKKYRKSKTRSLAGNLLGLIWGANGAAMLIVGFIGGFSGTIPGVLISPLMSVFLGVSYLLSGYIYGKKWVSYLTAFWWAGAIVMFLLPGLYTVLMMAGMMIVLQIIPGIVLYLDSKHEFAEV